MAITVHKEGESVMVPIELLSKALRAICLTRDYVGESLLPALDGWEWYEAGNALAEAIPDDEWAKQFYARITPQDG